LQPHSSLSVIVVSYNSRDALAGLLPVLTAQFEDRDEVIVVDNASDDGSADSAAGARVIRNTENLGFAAACNQGADVARGELLVFLNPDSVPAEGFADAIRRPLLQERGWSAWMGLVTAERGHVINTSGGIVHFTGISWAGQADAPAAQAPREPQEVPFVSGACFAIPRATWARHGGFAEHFFMYCEDVDLSLRLRLWGGALGIEPRARVDHDYEFAKGKRKWRLLERNRWATILRTYPAPLLLLLLPALLLTEIGVLAAAVAGSWGWQKARAWADVAVALPRLVRERRAIQSQREVTSREFAQALTPDLDSAYLGRAASSGALRAGLRAYWRVVLFLLRIARA
jgi:GT2 family glycosyltransferase